MVTPQEDIWQGASAARFIEEVKLKAPQIAGFMTMLYEHSKMVISGFQLGALIASLLVIVLLWFDFRSLRDALTCLLPLMMGWCWMFVGMQVFGLELNVANIVVLPLILGIGVDTSVHIMHRVREEERLHTQASLFRCNLRNWSSGPLRRSYHNGWLRWSYCRRQRCHEKPRLPRWFWQS